MPRPLAVVRAGLAEDRPGGKQSGCIGLDAGPMVNPLPGLWRDGVDGAVVCTGAWSQRTVGATADIRRLESPGAGLGGRRAGSGRGAPSGSGRAGSVQPAGQGSRAVRRRPTRSYRPASTVRASGRGAARLVGLDEPLELIDLRMCSALVPGRFPGRCLHLMLKASVALLGHMLCNETTHDNGFSWTWGPCQATGGGPGRASRRLRTA